MSSSAEETINPNKTLPRGILLSLAVSTVLYVIMTLIMTGVVPYKEFAKYIDAPVAGVILETGMNWLAVIVNLAPHRHDHGDARAAVRPIPYLLRHEP